MKKTPEKLIESLKNISLSSSENSALRERLLSYVDLHAMPDAQPVPSFISYSIFYSRAAISGVLAVIILIGTTGVTFAAQNTLPGQALYSVKVSLTEPLQGAFITSPKAKADWQNTLAERRLVEATTLAAQNNLSSSTESYLSTQVAIHVQASEADSATLAAAGDATSSLSVQADLQARLDAHTQLLATITTRLADAGYATSSQQVASLIQKIDTQRVAVAEARQAAIVAITSSDSSTMAPDSVDSATTTPTELAVADNARTVSYVRAQDEALHREESSIFQKSAALLSLLPQPISTTSSATTTEATSTEDQNSGDATTTVSDPSTTTVSASSTEEISPLTGSTTPKFLQPWRKLRKSL